MRHATTFGFFLSALVFYGCDAAPEEATAQDSVEQLQDLVGARGGQAEGELESRGYEFVRTEKSDDSSYSYWVEQDSGKCVTVRTTEGRYASIIYTPSADCEARPEAQNTASNESQDEFQTICGVIIPEETSRDECRVVDHYAGSEKVKTNLYFPDFMMDLTWQPDSKVLVNVDGEDWGTFDFATYEGETNFQVDRKTFYYISNKDMARQEVGAQ